MTLKITLIPALADNYIYALECTKTGEIAILDPADAAPVLQHLNGRTPQKILLTHHHADHINGVPELAQKFSPEIYGSATDEDERNFNTPLTHRLKATDTLTVGAHTAEVLNLAGHTKNHIGFYFSDAHGSTGALFSGDALFAGGCGRIFCGTHANMFQTMHTIKALPPQTKIYAGHEYTLSNLKFAAHTAPNNQNIQTRLAEVIALRDAQKPTLPTTLEIELATNLFLTATTQSNFTALRNAKDAF